LLCAALAAVGCAPSHPDDGRKIAALVFRDTVPGYQRWGSKGFTLSYLDGKSYDHIEYLQQDDLGVETRAVFVDKLNDELRTHDAVDLFLLVCYGRHIDWITSGVPAELRSKLRMVYNTGGGGGAQASEWQALGAKAYVSHSPYDGNLAPFFYVDFLRNWTEGQNLEEAVSHANASFRDRLHGFGGSVILRASGLPDDPTSVARWEAATRATITGQDGLRVR
jgi:hypothetical protein